MTRSAEIVQADLRTAYLLAFDNFSTDPIEVGNAVNGNSRYGRELLGMLTQGDIVCDTRVGEGNADQVWQACQTYDSITRDEAIEIFEKWLAERTVPQAPAAKPVNNLPGCRCGCGQQVNKGREYKPGHDARHAGVVGRALAAHPELLETLPSAALRAKAQAVAAKAGQGKAKAGKTAPKAAPVTEDGTVKIGRWVYPATRRAGVVTYITKGKISCTATAEQAARFTPGK